jgi:hypothetical protein
MDKVNPQRKERSPSMGANIFEYIYRYEESVTEGVRLWRLTYAVWYDLEGYEANKIGNNTLNNSSNNPNEKICEYCGSNKTYNAFTKAGTPYPKME